jgi:hypothetical protein
LSSSESFTPWRSAIISRAVPPIVPNSSYTPVNIAVSHDVRNCPNQACRVEASPKTRSKCGSNASRSNSVSFTSNTQTLAMASPSLLVAPVGGYEKGGGMPPQR